MEARATLGGRIALSSGVVTIPVPIAIYREEQLFGWWIYALLGVMVALSCYFLKIRLEGAEGTDNYPHSFGIIVGFALPAMLVIGVLRMTTEVTVGRIDVSFGWLPSYRRSVNLGAIERVETVRYRPLVDCRGWGIRSGRDGERVLSARGNRGVRLHMIDGSRLLLGSQRPEELASAINNAIHPGS